MFPAHGRRRFWSLGASRTYCRGLVIRMFYIKNVSIPLLVSPYVTSFAGIASANGVKASKSDSLYLSPCLKFSVYDSRKQIKKKERLLYAGTEISIMFSPVRSVVSPRNAATTSMRIRLVRFCPPCRPRSCKQESWTKPSMSSVLIGAAR